MLGARQYDDDPYYSDAQVPNVVWLTPYHPHVDPEASVASNGSSGPPGWLDGWTYPGILLTGSTKTDDIPSASVAALHAGDMPCAKIRRDKYRGHILNTGSRCSYCVSWDQ